MIAGGANDPKVQVQAGVTLEKLMQLILKLMGTSSYRDTVCGSVSFAWADLKSMIVMYSLHNFQKFLAGAGFFR